MMYPPPPVVRSTQWSTITPYGGVYRMETHLVAYGLAAMFDGARLRYIEDRIEVRVPYSRSDVEVVVKHHVDAMLNSEYGWAVRGSGQPHTHGWKTPSCAVSPFYGDTSKIRTEEKTAVLPEQVMSDIYSRRNRALNALAEDHVQSAVVAAMGVPQYWKAKLKPSSGASQILMRAVNGGGDPLSNRVVGAPDVRRVDSMTGADFLRAVEDPDTANTPEGQFGNDLTSGIRTAVAMHGLWALPTSIGVGVAARTFGCVYAPRQVQKEKGVVETEERVYSRSTARVVLPRFHHDVSLEKIRSTLSHRDWLPTPKGNKPRGSAIEYDFSSRKVRNFHRNQGCTPIMWSVGSYEIAKSTYGFVSEVVTS